jgi:molybdenum cofactor cytidylyltransferase
MIVGILLAAGVGRRFGVQKLLYPVEDGVPMVVKAARNLDGAVDRTLAVVRPGEDRVARLLEAEGVEVSGRPGRRRAWDQVLRGV